MEMEDANPKLEVFERTHHVRRYICYLGYAIIIL